MKRVLIAIIMLGLVIGGFFLWQVYTRAEQRKAVRATVNNYLEASKKGDIKSVYALLTTELRLRSPSPKMAADIIKERQKKAGKVVGWKIKKLEIKGGTRATVEVSVKSEQANYVSIFDLRIENEKWRVNNIQSKKTKD